MSEDLDLTPGETLDFEPAWLNDFLRALHQHEGNIAQAAKAIARGPDLIYYHANRQPTFAETLERIRWQARQPLLHRLEDELLRLAETGDIEHVRHVVNANAQRGQPPDRIKVTRRMSQLLQLLERLDPDRWAPKPPPPADDHHLDLTIKFNMSDADPVTLEATDADITELNDNDPPALPPGEETR